MTSAYTSNEVSILKSYFNQVLDVFGTTIVATTGVTSENLNHTKAILSEYLDNNEDGIVDNQVVASTLKNEKAVLALFASEEAYENDFLVVENIFNQVGGNYQTLYNYEIRPAGSSESGGFDASIEEILHLITFKGYAKTYPSVFGATKGSELANSMDIARGGYFEDVPSSYPESAWYTYYDKTCNYDCQTQEYIYWGLTSLLGGQSYNGRIDQIKHEWRLNTPYLFKLNDTSLYNLIANPIYGFATQLPDGKYLTTTKSANNKSIVGTASNDNLEGESGDSFGNDTLSGGLGDDTLTGFRGADDLKGEAGDDVLRAGNGKDTLTGGSGSDTLYGGFGTNTFQDSNDGEADKLYLKSDQLAYNWIYSKAGNSPNGEKADNIGKLDANDQIFIQGATTAQLTFGSATHTTPFGETWSGIGIYAAGTLEAVFTGGNLSQSQLQAITFGADA